SARKRARRQAARAPSRSNASSPKLLAGERRPVAERAQLGPGDLRMDAAAEAAVGAGDQVFPADDLGERDDAVGHQLRMLDEIGRVADDAGNQDLSRGQLYVAPDFDFVLVADVAGF